MDIDQRSGAPARSSLERTMWKVGEVCERTGLTVRTLHHYEDIGLLGPIARTPAGHRQYGRREIERLLQIVALKQLGLSLEEVSRCLDEPSETLLATVEKRLRAVDRALAQQQRLREHLAALAFNLRRSESPSVEKVLETLEMMTMYEKYYTPEQLEQLAERREAMGQEALDESQRAWREVYDEAKAAMERGASPTDPDVCALRERARALVQAFTGGDPGIRDSLATMWREEPDVGAQFGFDKKVFAFLWGGGS